VAAGLFLFERKVMQYDRYYKDWSARTDPHNSDFETYFTLKSGGPRASGPPAGPEDYLGY